MSVRRDQYGIHFTGMVLKIRDRYCMEEDMMKCDCEGWKKWYVYGVGQTTWKRCPWCGKELHEELGPCAHCGGRASLEIRVSPFPYVVLCLNCGMQTKHYSEKAFAIDAWNRRPSA